MENVSLQLHVHVVCCYENNTQYANYSKLNLNTKCVNLLLTSAVHVFALKFLYHCNPLLLFNSYYFPTSSVVYRGTLAFNLCQDLKNPWNENKPVKIGRDGQVSVCVMCM